MKFNIKTISLVVAVILLLVSTIGITFVLRNDSSTAPTTARKVKASAQTYTTNISLNQPTAVPVPTSVIIATAVTPFPTTASTVGAQITETPVPSPTETLLAAAPVSSTTPTLIPTTVISATATPALTSLPTAGWVHVSLIIFISAATLIFVSFLY